MRFILAACLLVSGCVLAWADDQRLGAAEVEALLSGNTAVGDWRGTAYRQYFSEGGTTTYLQEGGVPSQGRWKADPASGDYCSWWERSGWSCYGIERDGDGYVWVVPDDSYRGPFRVVEGNRL